MRRNKHLAARAPIDRFAHDGANTRKGDASSMLTIAIMRKPSESMSSTSPRYTISLSSADDLTIALRTIAGLRISRQLPQSSFSTVSVVFCEAVCVFNIRLSATGSVWKRFWCNF